MMDAKEFLLQYQEYDLMAKRCMAEYKAEKEMIRRIRQLPSFRDFTSEIDSVVRTSEKWKDRAEVAAKQKIAVLNVLDSVPGIERDILYARYIEQMKWEDMSNRFCYSWNGIFKAHDRALRMLQDYLCGCSAVDD